MSTHANHTVVNGRPPADKAVSLLNSAYNGWGGEPLFSWKATYPDTTDDDHHLYIEENGQITAYARLYHRVLRLQDRTETVVFRGNSAVHPHYQGGGRYGALHRATKAYCADRGIETILTFNRTDSPTYTTSLKNAWRSRELPLFVRLLDPDAALRQYAQAVIEAQPVLRTVGTVFAPLFSLHIEGASIPLGALVDEESPAFARTFPFYLTPKAITEIIEMVSTDRSSTALARTLCSLAVNRQITPFTDITDGEPTPTPVVPETVTIAEPQSYSPEEKTAIRRVIHRANDPYPVHFRRSSRDLEHLLEHPDIIGTYLHSDGDTIDGFASVYAVSNEGATEARILEFAADTSTAASALIQAIEADCRRHDVAILAGFFDTRPTPQWCAVDRHVLMWQSSSARVNAALDSSDWRLGFYDVV